MCSARVEADSSLDLREQVRSLSEHYGVSDDVAAALGTLAAMAADPAEGVLPRRPATNRLIIVRLSSCMAGVELEQVGNARRIVDIGSGLGFPGLVLAAMLPQASVTLIERKRERCEFLRRAVDAMGLTDVEVVNKQAQSWREGAASAELATARAVAGLSHVLRLAAPLVAVGGTAVIWGAPKRNAEEAAEAVAEQVGFGPSTVHPTKPAGLGTRPLYVYEKVAEIAPRRKADRKVGQRERTRARQAAVGGAQQRAEERLQVAVRAVEELEASEAGSPNAAAELERFRAIVHKMERKVEQLARRRARADRKYQGRATGLDRDS